jgi:heme-degrading monooxygenase HmoA
MIVVLFRSRLSADAGEEYQEMAEEMLSTAKTMPGFVDFKSYKAEDGERVSIVRWEDQESMAEWRAHPRHRVAQNLGQEKWYDWYQIEVLEQVRSASFQRE